MITMWCSHFLQPTNYGKHFPRAILTNLTKNPSFGRPVSSSSRSFSENWGHGQIDISTNYGLASHGSNFLLLMNYGVHFHKAALQGNFSTLSQNPSKSANYHIITRFQLLLECNNEIMRHQDTNTCFSNSSHMPYQHFFCH